MFRERQAAGAVNGLGLQRHHPSRRHSEIVGEKRDIRRVTDERGRERPQADDPGGWIDERPYLRYLRLEVDPTH